MPLTSRWHFCFGINNSKSIKLLLHSLPRACRSGKVALFYQVNSIRLPISRSERKERKNAASYSRSDRHGKLLND
jgi:hypothetical protein